MPANNFDVFLNDFFALYLGTGFATQHDGSGDFLHYITTSPRSGDEASVVDAALTAPLLAILGFEPSEQIYNQEKHGDRPDFAPRIAEYGMCFLVEDKNTSLELDLDLSRPNGHLRQLRDYARVRAIPQGILTNGRRMLLYRFAEADAEPSPLADLLLIDLIISWKQGGAEAISADARAGLQTLFDLFRRDAFAEPLRLEEALAISEEEWKAAALPLGQGAGNEPQLVESLQGLVRTLADDAERVLREHLRRFTEYEGKARFLSDSELIAPQERFGQLRDSIRQRLAPLKPLLGLTEADIQAIESPLTLLEQDARAFLNPDEVRDSVLAAVRGALERKNGGKKKNGRDELTSLAQTVEAFANVAFAHHQRQAALRQRYRISIQVRDDYQVWESLVRETMLGGLTEEEKQSEFALQAAYVVFIRLLLIRVCEDKKIFPQRFLTDGGIVEWRKAIARYWQFAHGNPYEPLLNMAYKNAQNIYAHFFTGRELFNWYLLDLPRLLLTLNQLSRFDFADVDSDIVGTVYSTYVGRKEKKKRGQYYTPLPIVEYILDGVGYIPGPDIIGGTKRLIDPACGSGTFLVTAARRLVEAYKSASGLVADPVTVLEQVRNSLFGFDLNPFACYLAEVNLLIQILPLVKAVCDATQRPPRLERFHIYNVDALATPTRSFYYAQMGDLMAEERDEVNRIKSRAPGTPYAGGFAFVVANPPYGAELSDAYKRTLTADYADVWRGQPDTYVFFYELALRLLARNGKLGFITPNTFLMGTNTNRLRKRLLEAGRVTEIVDLPQGIWGDANVDCVLLFLTAEEDAAKRREQTVTAHLLGLKDTLDKLTDRDWRETLTHTQSDWLPADPNDERDHKFEMNFRQDALLERIESACLIATNGESQKILRLGEVTDSSAGIDPYETEQDGKSNLYIREQRNLPRNEPEWRPLLDRYSFVGRYELMWGEKRHYIKYGSWLERAREPKFFDSPKLLVQDMRNRALKRRLVATLDTTGFYNRKNFNNIINSGTDFDLRYLLALFNSSLLNYYFARRLDNLHVNPAYFRNLPVFRADAGTQGEIAGLVDKIIAVKAEINAFREKGYRIVATTGRVDVPYDALLAELQTQDPDFPALTLFQAQFAGLLSLPEVCAPRAATVTLSRVFTTARHPETVTLRHPLLWLNVPVEPVRRYLIGYLNRPQWRGQTFDAIKSVALLPENPETFDRFFAREAERIAHIRALLSDADAIDRQIDNRVLDLYNITDPADRQRILGDALSAEETTDEEIAAVTE